MRDAGAVHRRALAVAEGLGRDLKRAVRDLMRRPGYALAAAGTLALGIGLNTAAFGLIHGLLLQPLPVEEPSRLLRLYRRSPEAALSHGPVRWGDLEAVRQQAASVDDVAAYVYAPLALEHAGGPRLAMGEVVSPNYFTLLGVGAAHGRVFSEREAREPLAVLSHRAWRRWFAGGEVLGGALRVNGQAYTIAGVAPEGFGGLTRGLSTEIWLSRESIGWPQSGNPWAVARLRSGFSADDARVELGLIGTRLDQSESPSGDPGELVALSANHVRLLPQLDGTLTNASALLMALAAIVLALAVVNVSHLTLVRGLGRQRELATRLALGASRGAVYRVLLAEALVLSVSGGLLGVGLAAGLHSAVGGLRVPLPVDVAPMPSLDPGVLLLTLLVSLAVGVAAAAAPVRFARRLDLLQALHGGSGLSRRGGRRSALMPLQVALCFVLLVSAGLCLKSLRHAETLDPGFDTDGVVVATVAPQLQGYGGETLERFYRDLLLRVRARRDVLAAGLISHLPLSLEWVEQRVAASGQGSEEWLAVGTAGVSRGYFESLRIPLRRGRAFVESDDAAASPVAVINETLAARLWPAGSALGRRLRVRGEASELEVVGVVADGRYRSLGEPPRGFLYRPLAQGGVAGGDSAVSSGSRTLVVRTPSAPDAFGVALRETLRELDPGLAVAQLEPLERALGHVLWLPRTAARTFGLFGLLALALAATGIYGVLAFSAAQRRREMGVRMALGARPRDMRRLVLREAFSLTAGGVLLGLGLSWAVTRLLAVALYGVGPMDAATLSLVSLLLLAVAWAAALGPARRASGAAVVESLRAE
jgi:predicted permease